MIDPKRIMPLLSNMTVDGLLASGPSAKVYLVSRRIDGKKLALKHISIPATDSETRALIYAGAVKDEAAAQRYYTSQVKRREKCFESAEIPGLSGGSEVYRRWI